MFSGDDDTTFAGFTDRHSARLHELAVQLVGDGRGAEDLLQQALRLTARSWSHVEDPLVYTRGVLARKALAHRRRSGTQPGLDRLTPLQRTVVVLHSAEGLADSEIADALQLSETAVRTAAQGARVRLQELTA